jgi:parvulin-like peptidyl-prolyl isomerase
MLLVAYAGADKADETVARDKPAALARATELLGKLKAGADFAELARKESDAPSSAARGGTFGTHQKAEWPELHRALRDPLFALDLGGLHPEPIDAPYGYVLLSRCAVEKVRARHILIRYQGAKNADETVERTKEQAQAFAAEVRERLVKGEDFGAVARELSDDSSKERGGDLGTLGRGLLAEPFETALYVLKPGGLSPVVETEFGFHVIERLPLE